MTALSDPMEIVGLERSLDSNVPTQDTLSLMTSSSNKHSLQSFYPNELSAYQGSHLSTSLYNNRSVETMGSNNNSLEQHSLYHQPVQRKSPLESVMEQQTQLTKDLSTNSVELSSDPQNLRFEYPLDEPSSVKSKPKKSTPSMYRDQDRFVPINNIGRTMRNAIPKSGKVSKDAKECMQECVSEYISFLTSEASDRCIDEKRKTITGDDILFALSALGFDNYVEPLQQYLKKYRDFIRLDKTDKEEENGEDKRETSKHKQSSEILSTVPNAMSERLGESQLLTDPSYPHNILRMFYISSIIHF